MDTRIYKLLCWVMVYLPVLSWAEGDRVDIAHFSRGDLSGWQSKAFVGETRYSFQNKDGRTALRADSVAAASGLYREVNIDLGKTPILNWTWQAGNILAGANEHTRAGDDYPARVYVVFSGGLMFWRTRAINYVWSNSQAIDSSWLNAFTHNARMIAVESGPARLNQWVREKRDVRADFRSTGIRQPAQPVRNPW